MKGKKKSKLSTLVIWLALVAAVIFLLQSGKKARPTYREDFAAFKEDVAAGHVDEVRVIDNRVIVTLTDGETCYETLGVVDYELTKMLSEHGVTVHRGEEESPYRSLLLYAVIGVIVLAVLVFFLRRTGSGQVNILELRKSRARDIPDARKVTFADVGGCEEAKQLLGDVIDFLRNPKRWTAAGVRLPRGVLLEGPPGCGKTLLARAVAGETNAKFYQVSASEFVEMFVGVGAARVRDMFEIAAREAPAVIFIDELDAVGRRRGSGIGTGHDEREQTLNELLVCMDGFRDDAPVVVVAATNRPDILDRALLRPGRIDRQIRIPEPNRDQRLEILKIHTRNKPLAADVDLAAWADRAQGTSGADLENLANEAALLAVRRTRGADGQPVVVGREDFDRAWDLRSARTRTFDKLDAVLIESSTQLAEPTGTAVVRLILAEGGAVEGEVVWADAAYIKLRPSDDGDTTIIPKSQVKRIEALAGTQPATADEVVIDPWARQPPDVV